ncbi:hypothetical protein [Streptomyces sp. NPDC008265]|uniref:hypothetical protein n=1 Tax=Streptomyces sp. NPDC008265 TaxID=3364824 RepID=UPI0036E8425E
MPDTCWKEMLAALDALADVRRPRTAKAVPEEYLRRVIPQFTGHQVEDVDWTTAHGDLHYDNLTRGPNILDREGWAAPRTATTRPPCTCTPCSPRPGPARDSHRTADRLRPGPQAQDRTDFYAELADPVREQLAHR